MASDLPPYLTHNRARGVAWKGHNTFPRNVVRIHDGESWGAYGMLNLKDLRIFRLSYGFIGDAQYIELHDTEIQRYMDDPTHA